MRISGLMTAAAMLALAACNQGKAPDNAEGEDSNVAASAGNLTATAAVSGDEAKALMKTRHDNYEKMGDAMKVISQELKGDHPDLAKLRPAADTIATFAPQMKSWFPAGTGPEAGKTRAKAGIWEKPEDFAAKTAEFERAAATFQAATKGSDVAAMKAAQGDLGKTCKACHDPYREPEHD